jgi:hypothetical protein
MTRMSTAKTPANAPLPDVLHTIELIDRTLSARGET